MHVQEITPIHQQRRKFRYPRSGSHNLLKQVKTLSLTDIGFVGFPHLNLKGFFCEATLIIDLVIPMLPFGLQMSILW